jgi:P2-related tail formation protein
MQESSIFDVTKLKALKFDNIIFVGQAFRPANCEAEALPYLAC